MKWIGITGGVGSGKSAVMRYLAEHVPCRVLLADDLSRDQMRVGGAAYAPVRALFGEDVAGSDGELDRARIAARVFRNPALLQQLNGITHPLVMRGIEEQVQAAREAGVPYFFLEAALLIESGYGARCDELWYVYAQEAVRRQRLASSRGYTDKKIDEIMARQLPEDAFRAHCSFVLDNSGDFAQTARQIQAHLAEA